MMHKMDLFVERSILSVSQLTQLLKGVIEENFHQVWVQGEISNLSMPQSGHCYFTLKDSGAQLRGVMFRGAAKMLRFRLQDGLGVIVRGRLTVYDQRGDYQILADYLEPVGFGALQLAFQQLKEKLSREGLFDPSHKKEIPQFPQRIGIVTSPTGAAIHDILKVLLRRFAGMEVLILPVRVQGEGAAEEIAAALRDFNRLDTVDVLIVGRGGGSVEDLWAFNEEVVARAIYASRIPVISAVGHEVDITISDLVADLRAPTPSAAAEMVIKSKAELAEQVAVLSLRLRQAMHHRLAAVRTNLGYCTRLLKDPVLLIGYHQQRVDDYSERLSGCGRKLVNVRTEKVTTLSERLRLQTPAVRLQRQRERLQMQENRLQQQMRRRVDNARESLSLPLARLHALSPLAVLDRGYAIALRIPGNAVVRDAAILSVGENLQVTFRTGSALCRVEEIPPAL